MKVPRFFLGALLSALIVAGCGGTKAVEVAHNPQAKQDVAKAQAIVQSCVTKADFLTSKGRKALISCIAPPGHEVAFESCASKALAHPFFTHKERERILQAVVVCLEENR